MFEAFAEKFQQLSRRISFKRGFKLQKFDERILIWHVAAIEGPTPTTPQAPEDALRNLAQHLDEEKPNNYMILNFTPFADELCSQCHTGIVVDFFVSNHDQAERAQMRSKMPLPPPQQQSMENFSLLMHFCFMLHRWIIADRDHIAVFAFVAEAPHHSIVDYSAMLCTCYQLFSGALDVAFGPKALADVEKRHNLQRSAVMAASQELYVTYFHLMFDVPQLPNPNRLKLHRVSLHNLDPAIVHNLSSLVIECQGSAKDFGASSWISEADTAAALAASASFGSTPPPTPPPRGENRVPGRTSPIPETGRQQGRRSRRGSVVGELHTDLNISVFGDFSVTVYVYDTTGDASPRRRPLFRCAFSTIFVHQQQQRIKAKDMDYVVSRDGLNATAGGGTPTGTGGFSSSEAQLSDDFYAILHFGEAPPEPTDEQYIDELTSRIEQSPMKRILNERLEAEIAMTVGASRLPSLAPAAAAHSMMPSRAGSPTAGGRGQSMAGGGARGPTKNSRGFVVHRLRSDPLLLAAINELKSAFREPLITPESLAGGGWHDDPAIAATEDEADFTTVLRAGSVAGSSTAATLAGSGTGGVEAAEARVAALRDVPHSSAPKSPLLRPATPTVAAPDATDVVCAPPSGSLGLPPLPPPPTGLPPPPPPGKAPPPPLQHPQAKAPLPPPSPPPPPGGLPPPPPPGKAPPPPPGGMPPPPLSKGPPGAPPPPPPPPPPGGFKGGPPPPPPPPPGKFGIPPPPGAFAAAAPAYTGPKLKPVFWKKVPADRANRGVWSRHADDVPIDEELLLDVFEVRAKPAKKEERKKAEPVKASKKSTAVSSQRGQNVGIGLKKLKLGVMEICNALIACDDAVLDDERLEALAKILPAEEEVKALRLERERVPDVEWGAVETFLFEVGTRVPDARERIMLWNCAKEFTELLSTAEDTIATLERAVACVNAPSGRLARVLRLLLAMGNFLNRGNGAYANAGGFAMESLMTVALSKGNDGKTTVLDTLVDQLLEKSADLLRLPGDLDALRPAVAVPLAVASQQMQLLSHALQRMKKVAGSSSSGSKDTSKSSAAHADGAGPVDGLGALVTRCLKQHQQAVVTLAMRHQSLKSDVAEMLVFLGEDAGAEEAVVWSHLLNFAKLLDETVPKRIAARKARELDADAANDNNREAD